MGIRLDLGRAVAEERFIKRAAKQRDAAILQSLLACFNERGCVETTLDQVATDVGIGKGTLYRHYSSREDLFEAALRAGIEALMDRCRGISETHAADFNAAFRALIGDLVALNRRGDPLSPATLARLYCNCRWLNPSQPNNGKLELALTPLVRDWQAAGLFDRTTDSSCIAAVMVAVVNALAVTRHGAKEPVASPVANTDPGRPAHDADIAGRIVEVLLRAFAPAAQSTTAVIAL